MPRSLITLLAALSVVCAYAFNVTDYVDPSIGSEGLGRVFIGPSMPYGMLKPGPDCVSMPNSGWAPMPEAIKGFSQVHVSGTGGGQKYGNILVMPFVGNPDDVSDTRQDENIKLGYYSTTLSSGISVQITTANKAAIYQINYPDVTTCGLDIDAGAFLGMSPVPDQRETQQLVGSQIEIVSDTEIRGYNRVRGGWNNGRAYTVYFYAVTSRPFKATTRKDGVVSDIQWQSDTNRPTGASLLFAEGTDSLTLKIGISFISELKARENLYAEIPDWNFSRVYDSNLRAWDKILSRIDIGDKSTDRQRRMFYTALYHTMIMPTDRTGECPLWSDQTPYYDDYYAIWDTYRTSMPLITLIDQQRQVDMINSMLTIYRRDGYLPDARSGNANGRTQGGSNAEIAIADAFVKRLPGIDYNLALEAMLKDALVPPGGNEEAEGRGGLVEYNSLGYVPYGIDRAGNRTIEYSYCDFAIAEVAKGLGKEDIYERFMRQSGNWRNLWRDDYEHEGSKGFIMPRDANGCWLDSIVQGHSYSYAPKYKYTPIIFEGPWYTPWWGMFFYEASSWEYSLSIPHDIPGLIEKCGGKEAMLKRLDTFFDRGLNGAQGFYNVNNEPSFLTPCFYHWLGKPYMSSDRIRQIIDANFNDGKVGLPGNDDSGAMSSWLAFHMIGLFPNAGQDYYLINSPILETVTLHLADGKDFVINAENLSDKNRYITEAYLNGEQYPYSSLHHDDIINGGTLTLKMGSKPTEWGASLAPASTIPVYESPKKAVDDVQLSSQVCGQEMMLVFKIHQQTRRYRVRFTEEENGDLTMHWGIERNFKWQQGSFTMTREALENAQYLSFRMPVDGENVTLPSDQTAYVISRSNIESLKTTGYMTCNNTLYTLADDIKEDIIHVNGEDGSQMWILDDKILLILRITNNPLEVDYYIKPI